MGDKTRQSLLTVTYLLSPIPHPHPPSPFYACFLWQPAHLVVPGALASGRFFITSSWQPAQLRWKASWLVSTSVAVLPSCLISGMAGSALGVSSLRAWQLRQPTTPTPPGSFSRSSAVSVVVRSGG